MLQEKKIKKSYSIPFSVMPNLLKAQLAINLSKSLLGKKRFVLDEIFLKNDSKFAIIFDYENTRRFFRFSFHAT